MFRLTPGLQGILSEDLKGSKNALIIPQKESEGRTYQEEL